MFDIYTDLKKLQLKLKSSNLAESLIYLTSYAYFNGDSISSSSATFSLNVDPSSILDVPTHAALLTSINGTCDITTTTDFDRAKGVLRVSFNKIEYSNNPICNNALALDNFGTTSFNPSLSIDIDVRSLFTAVAINQGILKVDELQEIPSLAFTLNGEGLIVNGKVYYNPRYPQMAALACLTVDSKIFCGLRFGDIISLPIINHFDISSTTEYYPCDCSDLDSQEHLEFCNTIQFLYGVFFWNTKSSYGAIRMVLKQTSESKSLSQQALGASIAITTAKLNGASFDTSLFSFCNDTVLGTCSFLQIASIGRPDDWTISPSKFQLKYGSCNSSVTIISLDKWQKIIDTTFANLTQQYTTCSYGTFDAIVQALGITEGTLILLMPLIVIASLIGVYSVGK